MANLAGVSKSTVSLVLRDSPLVRNSTRTKVHAAMGELGYIYNRAAAKMRAAHAGLIGLVINDLRNPFFVEFATSLQMTLASQNYSTVIANTNESPEIQDQVIRAMIEHGVAAIVISPAYGRVSKTFDAIGKADVPAMQVLRKVEQRISRFPFAAPDYCHGGRIATQHLIDCGARRIAFVGGLSDRSVTDERVSGYKAVLKDHCIAPISLTGEGTRSFGIQAARQLQEQFDGVDAAVCFNDLVAIGMLMEFARTGRAVGTSFRIVGFDDIEDCPHMFPSLSSVHCGISEFSVRVAEMILEWIEEGSRPVAELRTPVGLSMRESSIGHRMGNS